MSSYQGTSRSFGGEPSYSRACSSSSNRTTATRCSTCSTDRVSPSTPTRLYPLLRRLEKQGLLTSDWNTDESRPRKFYQTSREGSALADLLSRDWDDLDVAFRTLKGES